MRNKLLIFLLFGTVILTSSFYENGWGIVEPTHYKKWERTYERVVVARLAKSQQDGIFSAGGLLGLANTPDGWNFDPNQQYMIYESEVTVDSFLVYKSHPGIQGIILSWFDKLTSFSPTQNLIIIRLSVSVLSALIMSALCAYLAIEYGWLSAFLVLLFSASSEWMILPSSNSYWNLWAFFLPFVATALILGKAGRESKFPSIKIYGTIFVTMLIKVLTTGFEMMTTSLIMTTVPFIYYAIVNKWKWKTLFCRLSITGLALLASTATGLVILMIQISVHDASIKSAIRYVQGTLDRRAFGNPENYRGTYKESLEVSLPTVIRTYLNINAFSTNDVTLLPWQLRYWELITIFAVATIIYLLKYKWLKDDIPAKGLGLIISTWYSIAAPLSWYIIFKPSSYIHTFLFPMAWQMPFTLLGFALCGFVITDLFKRKPV